MMVKVDRVCYLSGAPHRVNGKVSGHLLVGHSPVHFTDVDLHAYVVGNDGRAYTAISHIPQPAAQALLPLTPIGGLFGWLFALERPGWENGFSLTGEQGRGHHCFGGVEAWVSTQWKRIHLLQSHTGGLVLSEVMGDGLALQDCF